MEFLVSMTTHVPSGTSEQSVQDVRTREAAHSGELAAEGRLLRLWRPPLAPGEWRTLGLFAADDAEQLEHNLASMPLRIWRTDVVTPLLPHPNDPGPTGMSLSGGWGESLTTFTDSVPMGAPMTPLEDIGGLHVGEPSEQAFLARLWWERRPSIVLALWRAHTTTDLEAALRSLPLPESTSVETTPLSPHPSDPLLQGD